MAGIYYNGVLIPGDGPVLNVKNRGYRFGDAIFETMRVCNGILILANLHFERLRYGLELVKFPMPASFNQDNIMKEVLDLCRFNQCIDSARVRLSVSRGNGSLDEDPMPEYIIECKPLELLYYEMNKTGLSIDIYPNAVKSCDLFSNLKSANHLPSVMGALYAREKELDDCLLLNSEGNIAESTIANIFLIHDETIITPSLDQGCVAGVMRRYLIEKLQAASYKLQERPCSIKDLYEADEVFLTNAIRGIQWVRSFNSSVYVHERTKELFSGFIKNLQPVSHQSGD